MRILGFGRKWPKLQQEEFTTFRYPRGDYDWYVGERVKIVIQPRRKGGGEFLGEAEIIGKDRREFDKEYSEMVKDDIPLITEAEVIVDGFTSIEDMIAWLRKTYGRLDWMPRMNKLALKWVTFKKLEVSNAGE